MSTNCGIEATTPRNLLYLKPSSVDDMISHAITDRGWSVDLAGDPAEALEHLANNEYAVGVFQLDGRDIDFQDVCTQVELMLDANSRLNWIALLSNVNGLQLQLPSIISRYCYDYHTSPVDTERLLTTLGHAYGMSRMAAGNSIASTQLPLLSNMVGVSVHMQALHRQIAKVAAIDFNVLIRGESGTGKELAAEAIHQSSHRASGPFIAVNCGALSKDLIRTELFGHEKGAFTGADRRHVGRIEAAQHGTLFLDEIGDLPLELQINLLRFLQEKTIDRVGGSGQLALDVRVIAATNVNLEQAVKEGRFREDLYYRLNVLQLETPPLRERREDITPLADHFFEKFSKSINPNLKGYSQQAIDALNAHYWPGNVRELVNRVQRAVVMCDGKLIRIRDLGLNQETTSNLGTLAQARSKADKQVLESTLALVRNNVSQAARHLDVSRVTLYRLMQLHDISWQTNNE